MFCTLQRYIYFHKNPNNIIAVRQKGIKSLVSYIISTIIWHALIYEGLRVPKAHNPINPALNTVGVQCGENCAHLHACRRYATT